MEDDAKSIRPLRKSKTVRDVEREAHEAAGHTAYRGLVRPLRDRSWERRSTSTTGGSFERKLEAIDCSGLRLA